MLLSCLVAEVAFWKMFAAAPEHRFFENHLWTMWQSGVLKVNLSFGLDPLGMMMTMIVTHVATLIHSYSTGYMADEPAYWRFFMWLNLFVFSMLLLVMGSNFVVMFFGWEGVGLCSYGLIGFWYEDIEKAKAAMKAFGIAVGWRQIEVVALESGAVALRLHDVATNVRDVALSLSHEGDYATAVVVTQS